MAPPNIEIHASGVILSELGDKYTFDTRLLCFVFIDLLLSHGPRPVVPPNVLLVGMNRYKASLTHADGYRGGAPRWSYIRQGTLPSEDLRLDFDSFCRVAGEGAVFHDFDCFLTLFLQWNRVYQEAGVAIRWGSPDAPRSLGVVWWQGQLWAIDPCGAIAPAGPQVRLIRFSEMSHLLNAMAHVVGRGAPLPLDICLLLRDRPTTIYGRH